MSVRHTVFVLLLKATNWSAANIVVVPNANAKIVIINVFMPQRYALF